MNFSNEKEFIKYCKTILCIDCKIRNECEECIRVNNSKRQVYIATTKHFQDLLKYFRKEKLKKLLS